MGALQVGLGNFQSADERFAQAVQSAQRRFGENSIETARYLDSYASNLDDMGRRTQALALHRRVLAIPANACLE